MLNRRSKRFTCIPASKLLRETSTPVGRYIIYCIVFCTIFAKFLNVLLSHLIDSEELVIGLTIGTVSILLAVLMLKMKHITGIIEMKRMERFDRRLEEKRRENEKVDV